MHARTLCQLPHPHLTNARSNSHHHRRTLVQAPLQMYKQQTSFNEQLQRDDHREGRGGTDVNHLNMIAATTTTTTPGRTKRTKKTTKVFLLQSPITREPKEQDGTGAKAACCMCGGTTSCTALTGA